MANEGTVPSPGPMSPVLTAQYAYPETMATAPMARLITPEPRYVATRPRAKPAVRAPVPMPKSAKRIS